MSKKRPPKKPPNPATATVHEAALGAHGIVYRGLRISKSQAVAIRCEGKDIVVCGLDTRTNRKLAKEIEDAVGPNLHHDPSLGPDSLPHYQPQSRPPSGHCFYERNLSKSKKLP